MGYVNLAAVSYWLSVSTAEQSIIGKYVNDTGKTVVVKSFTSPVGVGKKGSPFTWGTPVTGTGVPINYYVQCAGVNSNTVTISNEVPSSQGEGGYYPDRRYCVSVTVSFSSDIIVKPGGTVYFSLPFIINNTASVFIRNYSAESVAVQEYNPITYYTVSYDAHGGTDAPAQQKKASNADLTLTTSKPTAPKLTLTFNANGGSVSISSKTYPRKFVCWNTKSDGTGTNYNSGGTFSTNADTTLYAQWGTAMVTDDVDEIKPTRDGYIFKGWFTSEGTQIVRWSLISKDTTVYAKWQAAYTVLYDANGGSGAPKAQTKKQGETLTLTTSTPSTAKKLTITFNPNGGSVSPTSKELTCAFLRWSTNSSGTGTNYNPGDDYTADANATLYAIWGSASAGDLPTPTRSNCNFKGWYTSIDGGNKVDTTTKFSSSTTLYARWEYIIHYDLNGGVIGEGETTLPNSIKQHNVTLKLTALSPSKQGKTFLGWAENSTATTAAYAAGGNYTKNEPKTLYAVYGAKTFKVTFDLKGGTYTGGGALVQYIAYGENATLPNNPTHSDKIFRGWVGNHTNIQADTTIYALWNGSPVWIKKSDGKWHSYID